MNQVLLWLILFATAVTAVLSILLLNRLSGVYQNAGKEVRDELRDSREEARGAARELREELAAGLRSTGETLAKTFESIGKVQETQLEGMTRQLKELASSNQQELNRIRDTFDARVKELQQSNESKLEEMRRTVDEKLHDTLEKRLSESFKLVGDRLESVHKDLGEMQTLATGVGDLKRVLTNVRARGTWGEVQLGAILEQILTPEQYEKNVQVKRGSLERVEYALRLPGPKDEPSACLWLPIDSKYPLEEYQRLQSAADRADAEGVQAAAEGLARTARLEAAKIHEKYINPPDTTDFAIMFLPTEGLYAEVLRQPGLAEELQHTYRIVVAGPTTLSAILNSLRMGFQTLAIQERTTEVWRVLGAVKTEFAKFGEVLDRVRRQLDTASRTIEETGVRSRAMERKLRRVERLPDAEASAVLSLPTAATEGESEDDSTVEG